MGSHVVGPRCRLVERGVSGEARLGDQCRVGDVDSAQLAAGVGVAQVEQVPGVDQPEVLLRHVEGPGVGDRHPRSLNVKR